MNTPESKIPNRRAGGRFVYGKDGTFVSHTPCTKVGPEQAAKLGAAKPDTAQASTDKTAGKRPK